jgi:hypothetical protein
MAAASQWADPGGQVGVTTAGQQWASASVTHTCTLTVTDSYGASHTHSQTFTINREPNAKPVAVAGDAAKHSTNNAGTQTYTVPHDFYPTAETNEVLVTLYGGLTTDADGDKLKHKWECKLQGTNTVTAWATVEMPFPVQLGGISTGFTYNSEGGIQSGAGDPRYVASNSVIQTTTGWSDDSGNSGNGDLFKGTHTHDLNQVTVTLQPGTHTCTLTTTDTYNEASSATVTVTVNAEPNSNPNAGG